MSKGMGMGVLDWKGRGWNGIGRDGGLVVQIYERTKVINSGQFQEN